MKRALLALLFACARAPSTPAGYQGVVELHRRVLGFETQGRLKEVRVEKGQRVQAGEVLAVLDDGLLRPQRDAQAANARAADAQLELLRAGARGEDLRGAEAQSRAAQASEQTAREGLLRARALRSQGALPQAQLDEAEAAAKRAEAERQGADERARALRRGSRSQELKAAQARAEAAHAALALEEVRLERLSLSAPVAGVVIDRHAEPGEVAQPGAPVVTLGEPQRPYLDVFVPQQELAGLRTGLTATVRLDGEAESFAGSIESIAQETEFAPRFLFSERERSALVVRVRVALADPRQRLHAGVPAFAELHREGEVRR